MLKENSGNIYEIPLDFNLGFLAGKFINYSDVGPFNGRLIFCFDYFFKNHNELDEKFSYDKLDILFGPVVIRKAPNSKGKGAWKLLKKNFIK